MLAIGAMLVTAGSWHACGERGKHAKNGSGRCRVYPPSRAGLRRDDCRLSAGAVLRSCHVLAWLGPAIGPSAFEVGDEVRAAFVAELPAAGEAFAPCGQGKWLADLYALARLRLARAGVTAVYGGNACTYSDPARYFSYRRDGVTGRMVTLIWLDGNDSV